MLRAAPFFKEHNEGSTQRAPTFDKFSSASIWVARLFCEANGAIVQVTPDWWFGFVEPLVLVEGKWGFPLLNHQTTHPNHQFEGS